MKPVRIICKVDKEDKFSMVGDVLEYNIEDNRTFLYTFWDNDLKKMPNFFPNVALDLLYISLFVFGADRIISRDMADDCWNREFILHIPVLEPDKWIVSKELLEQLLNYLSGDIWHLEFRHRELTKKELSFKDKIINASSTKILVDKTCMFSGGLDSFIGLIDLLQNSNKNVLFVSHYGGGKGVIEYQQVLKNKVIEEYGVTNAMFSSFYAVARNGIEDTTRTRSFMFFSHAIVLAASMPNQVELIIPENGLISLNIPLTNSRLGSSSTRTTHPYYIKMLGDLLNELGMNIKIMNPYQFKTKGEMIKQCSNLKFLSSLLDKTMSCSHPDQGRMQGETESRHCGNCLPCVIRRAAINASGIKDTTIYRDKDFTSGPTAKTNLISYQLGLKKYDPKYAFLNIQKSGPLVENIEDYVSLYKRGMDEVSELLEKYNE